MKNFPVAINFLLFFKDGYLLTFKFIIYTNYPFYR